MHQRERYSDIASEQKTSFDGNLACKSPSCRASGVLSRAVSKAEDVWLFRFASKVRVGGECLSYVVGSVGYGQQSQDVHSVGTIQTEAGDVGGTADPALHFRTVLTTSNQTAKRIKILGRGFHQLCQRWFTDNSGEHGEGCMQCRFGDAADSPHVPAYIFGTDGVWCTTPQLRPGETSLWVIVDNRFEISVLIVFKTLLPPLAIGLSNK
eukprot:6377315-Amphidinium_carterae.1